MALSSLRLIDMPHSSINKRPETNWSTRLAPQPRSDVSDQIRRSGYWGSDGTPARRFSKHLTTTTDPLHSRESKQLRLSRESPKDFRANWRDLIRRRPSGTRRQREDRRPNRLLQAMTFCFLQDRNSPI